VYPTFGKYDKAIRRLGRTIEIDPDFPVGYLQLAFNSQFLERFDEAEDALRRAAARKLEIPELAVQRYDIAFLKGDRAGMEREAARVRGKPAPDDLIPGREGVVLAYSGHLQQAQRLSRARRTRTCRPVSRDARLCGKPAPRCGTHFSEMPARPGRAHWPHWSTQKIAMSCMAPRSPLRSLENPRARKRSPTISNGGSRRTPRSNSCTCRRFERCSPSNVAITRRRSMC
jgi:hypothetical protein